MLSHTHKVTSIKKSDFFEIFRNFQKISRKRGNKLWQEKHHKHN